MKKNIILLPIVALLCVAMFSACPNRIVFDPPRIDIGVIGGDGDIITRGGSLELSASVHNFDVFDAAAVIWSIVELDPDGFTGTDGHPAPGEYEVETYITSRGPLAAHFAVYRNELLARNTFTVRARHYEFPALYAMRTFTVIDPSAEGEVYIVNTSHSVHRGEVSDPGDPLIGGINWIGLPPLRGSQGVHFVVYRGAVEGTATSVIPGYDRRGTVIVSPDQPYTQGRTGVPEAERLYVRAVSNYNNAFYSEPFAIEILQPYATSVHIGWPARVTLEGGIQRGEPNTFTATVLGRGHPSQEVNWFALGNWGPANPATITQGGVLTTPIGVAPDGIVTISADAVHSPIGRPAVYGTTQVTVQIPLIEEVTVTGPAMVTRGGAPVTFTAHVEGRGNPTGADLDVFWSIPTPGISHQTTITPGFGGSGGGTLTVSFDEFQGQIRVRATSRTNPRAHGNSPYVTLTGGRATAGWRMVSAGDYHALALTADHRLFSWGRNNHSQLGNNFANAGANVSIPAQITSPAPWRIVSANATHNIAITDDNRLFGWGSNTYGQLGRPPAVANEHTPGNIVGAVGHYWITADAGPRHTTGVKEYGTLYTFGANVATLIGRTHVPTPGAGLDGELRPHWQPGRVMVPGLSDYGWKSVSAGRDHSAAIRVDGSLWVWGENDFGQLGTAVAGTSRTPTQVNHPYGGAVGLANRGGARWESVNAGDGFTIAIDTNGDMWVWGSNSMGQLGNSVYGWFGYPRQIYVGEGGTGRRWTYVNSMIYHSIIMDDEGYMFVFGRNDYGQFGVGAFTVDPAQGIQMRRVRAPLLVDLATPDNQFLFGNSGGLFTVAVHQDGRLFTWGDNRFGQLGIGQIGIGTTAAPFFHDRPQLVEVELTP